MRNNLRPTIDVASSFIFVKLFNVRWWLVAGFYRKGIGGESSFLKARREGERERERENMEEDGVCVCVRVCVCVCVCECVKSFIPIIAQTNPIC